MPRTPMNRPSHKIKKEIKDLEKDIETTEYHCNRTINDKKEEIKRLNKLIKNPRTPSSKLSKLSKPPPPPKPSKLSKPPPPPKPSKPSSPSKPQDDNFNKMNRMEKRLKERKETLQFLRSLGEDTKVVEDEIIEIQDYLNSSHSISSDNSPDNSPDELPLLKVLFFDLDETILTSADPDLKVTRVRKELIKLGSVNIAPPGKLENLSDTITTKNIVNLLKECTRRDDVKWFIISQGENKDKVGQLFANYIDEIYPDNDDFGVSMFKHDNKRDSIEKILRKLDKAFYIPEAIFIDDRRENTEPVSKIEGVRVIDIPKERFNVEWLPITLMTKGNCDDIMNYLSGFHAASKRTKKKKKSINTKKGRSKKGRSKKGISKNK